MGNLMGMLPEIYMLFGVMVMLLIGKVKSEWNIWLGIELMLIGGLMSIMNVYISGEMINGSIRHSEITAIGKGLIYILGGLIMYISKGYIKEKKMQTLEYSGIQVMVVLGMGIMLGGNNMMSIYLGMEMQSLGMYVMATYTKGSRYSTEAGMKYFVMGALGSGIMLFGASQMYKNTGTTNIEEMGRIYNQGIEIESVIGLGMVSVGLLFKMGAAPFHFWAPDVYEGAPSSSSMVFGVLPKIALLGVLIRLLSTVMVSEIGSEIFGGMFGGLGILSIMVSATGTLYQRRIKRFLAYSSIGHVGFMLIGINTGTIEGIEGVMVYIQLYMLMSLNMWGAVVLMRKTNIDELAGLGKANPWLAMSIGAGVLSMAGIPPMAGFFGKYVVILGAMESGMYGLGLMSIVISVVGAFYYIRWVKIMYFETGKGDIRGVEKISKGTGIILGLSTVGMILFGLNPGPVFMLAQEMALSVV